MKTIERLMNVKSVEDFKSISVKDIIECPIEIANDLYKNLNSEDFYAPVWDSDIRIAKIVSKKCNKHGFEILPINYYFNTSTNVVEDINVNIRCKHESLDDYIMNPFYNFEKEFTSKYPNVNIDYRCDRYCTKEYLDNQLKNYKQGKGDNEISIKPTMDEKDAISILNCYGRAKKVINNRITKAIDTSINPMSEALNMVKYFKTIPEFTKNFKVVNHVRQKYNPHITIYPISAGKYDYIATIYPLQIESFLRDEDTLSYDTYYTISISSTNSEFLTYVDQYVNSKESCNNVLYKSTEYEFR